jgi:hypothetical protein
MGLEFWTDTRSTLITKVLIKKNIDAHLNMSAASPNSNLNQPLRTNTSIANMSMDSRRKRQKVEDSNEVGLA